MFLPARQFDDMLAVLQAGASRARRETRLSENEPKKTETAVANQAISRRFSSADLSTVFISRNREDHGKKTWRRIGHWQGTVPQ
jgi:hypothetical protein